MTKNLIAFDKDQEPKQDFFSMDTKIDLGLNLMKKDLWGIEVVRKKGPGVPELLADPGMIEHALLNLMQNAIHALSLVKHPKITIRTYCLTDRIYIVFKDNGCGIPGEYLENIYDPSFSMKGSSIVTGSYKEDLKGTGYGLSNVKKYITRHNRDIFVESEFDSGTTFTITLTVIEKELLKKKKWN